MSSELKKNLAALARKADESGRYRYTDFLSLAERQELYACEKELTYAGLTLWGGHENAERVVARFGTSEREEPFPIVCLKVAPLQQKFANELTHRDFLGSVLSLGLERSVIGDIVVSDNTGYVFCLARMADYIRENLRRVAVTSVSVEVCEGEISAEQKTEEATLFVHSLRADCFVAAAYKLSRREAEEAFAAGLVFVDGRAAEASDALKEGAVVSVRGKGKVRFLREEGKSRKDRICITAAYYR